MTTEQQTDQKEHRCFEVELTVKGAGKGDEVTISREYTSADAASADKASKEIWNSVNSDTLARMKPVSDGR